MKKQNRVLERNGRTAANIAQRKAPLCHYRIPLTKAEKTTIEAAAKKRGLTLNEFAERAIRAEASRDREVMPNESEPTESAQITAYQVIERAFKQQSPDDFVSILYSLRDLMLPHPGFQILCQAITGINDGHRVLCEFSRKVANI